ncbi:MAG: PEP-CTERM sorting domain-containing protein [Fibrella sp.]|nr:PEP-CTERM sorting domain-containing protein [Armatimonadota bacterium]
MLSSALFNRARRETVFAALALGFAAFAAAPGAHAQANLTFSGGNGTPITLTLADPITYTINVPYSGSGFSGFAMQNAGNLFNGSSGAPLSSTLTYSINGGGPLTMAYVGSGFGGLGSFSGDDTFFGGPNVTFVLGDIVTLTSGSITGSVSFSGPPPAPGSFTTFLFDGGLNRISANGVAGTVVVPEPCSLALLGIGALPLVGMMMRRRLR